MILHVLESRYVDRFRFFVRFNDGQSGIVDLEGELSGPVFEALQNLEVFKKGKVDEELSTIVWPNGADFAPEFLASKMMAHVS